MGGRDSTDKYGTRASVGKMAVGAEANAIEDREEKNEKGTSQIRDKQEGT